MTVEKNLTNVFINNPPQLISYFASFKYAARFAISSSVKGFAIMIIKAELGPILIPSL